MKQVQKPQTVLAMGRPLSVTKEFQAIPMQSPDKQIVYASKTQSQAKIQTYITSPYVQSPNYDTKSQYQIPPSPKKQLIDSYHYKQRGFETRSNENIRPDVARSGEYQQYQPYKPTDVYKNDFKNDTFRNETFKNETFRYDYTKTFTDNFNKDVLKDANTERRSNTTKKDGTSFQESRQFDTQNRSPLTEQTNKSLQYGILQPIKKSSEITKISGNLRDLLSAVQRHLGGQLSDELNDKMIDILSNFRRLEEQPQESQNNQDYEQRIQAMTEDYNKLKTIMDQLQGKVTALVEENQKLNKNLIEQEQRVGEEMRKRQVAEEKSLGSNKEFNRVFECLQINQRENEELRQKIHLLENAQSNKDTVICRNLFQDEQLRDLQKKLQQSQREYDQLESKFKQLQQQQQQDVPKSPSIVRSVNGKQEQLELKIFQLQIENDNLRAEMAHNLVDSKAMDNKNEMIQRLEEKVKQIMREKSQFEDQQAQVCQNYEILVEQLKQGQNQKDSENQQLLRARNDQEREIKNITQNYQTVAKNLENSLNQAKNDYTKLMDDYKLLDQKKNKLQDDLRSADKIVDQLTHELNHLRNENKKLSDRNNIQQNQIDQMGQQIQQQSQLQQSLVQQIESYKQQENQIRIEFERADNQWKIQRQELKNQLTEMNEQLGLQIRRCQEKERQHSEMVEEMGAMKDQYEVQKKVWNENQNDLERRLKNFKLQHEDILSVKDQEINDLKQAMDQQIKIIEKRTNLAQFDYEQREQQIMHDLQLKDEQIENLKSELEKLRSTNFNLQEELLRAGMLLTQHQTNQSNLKNELLQSKQEQQHLLDMLKKRKEEAEQLHFNLEEARKDQMTKNKVVDDGRRSIMRQQDLQITIDSLQRENMNLAQKISQFQNELNRKTRDVNDKNEELLIVKRKYEETLGHLERLEKRWGEKIDQHRKN